MNRMSPAPVIDLPDGPAWLDREHQACARELADLGRVPATAARARRRDQAVAGLVRHVVAEEAWLHRLIRRYLPGGAAAVERDMWLHDELEHHLESLARMPPDDPAFAARVDAVRATFDAHAVAAGGLLAQVRGLAPEDELAALGAHLRTLDRLAPVRADAGPLLADRPPPAATLRRGGADVRSPLLHEVVGPGPGMIDRLRDELAVRLAP